MSNLSLTDHGGGVGVEVGVDAGLGVIPQPAHAILGPSFLINQKKIIKEPEKDFDNFILPPFFFTKIALFLRK